MCVSHGNKVLEHNHQLARTSVLLTQPSLPLAKWSLQLSIAHVFNLPRSATYLHGKKALAFLKDPSSPGCSATRLIAESKKHPEK